MGLSPLFLLIGFLVLLLAAGVWVVRLRPHSVVRVAVVLPPGQNHPTVGRFTYFLSDYLDVEKQQRDKRLVEEHALKVARLRNHEDLTQHQAQLAAEQARDQAAWEANNEAIAQWLARQQRADAVLNPPPPPPALPVDFKDPSLSPTQRRKALFQQLKAASEAVPA